MLGKCRSCESTCEKIWFRTMVIYWTRFWKDILPRTVHKEPGTKLRSKCCWNFFAEGGDPTVRATTPLSRSIQKAKGEENWRFTSLQIKTQLIQLIELFFLSISSVSTEQWQLYAKNLRTIKKERGRTCDTDGSINCSWRSQSRRFFAQRKSHEWSNCMEASQETKNIWLPIEEEMPKQKVPKSPWPILTRSWFLCPNEHNRDEKSLSSMESSCRWRSHSPFDRRRESKLEQTVDSFT